STLTKYYNCAVNAVLKRTVEEICMAPDLGESAKIYVMNPLTLSKLRTFSVAGLFLATAVLGFSQGTPAPSRGLPPLGVPPAGPPRGNPGVFSSQCGQNRLTTAEQIQNGVSLLEIQQQETRAIAC